MQLTTSWRLALLDACFTATTRGVSYTLSSTNRGKDRYRLNYVLTRR